MIGLMLQSILIALIMWFSFPDEAVFTLDPYQGKAHVNYQSLKRLLVLLSAVMLLFLTGVIYATRHERYHCGHGAMEASEK